MFGDIVKELRLKRGFSQRQLAYLAKISNTEISKLENGERKNPSPDVLKKIAPHLGVNYSDLMISVGYWPSDEELPISPDPIKTSNPKLFEWWKSLFPYIEELPETSREQIASYIKFVAFQEKKNKS